LIIGGATPVYIGCHFSKICLAPGGTRVDRYGHTAWRFLPGCRLDTDYHSAEDEYDFEKIAFDQPGGAPKKLVLRVRLGTISPVFVGFSCISLFFGDIINLHW
jgi:hypothetical protein